MTSESQPVLARVAGLVCGATACAIALGFWAVAPSARTLGADLRVISTPPGELSVTPTGTVLTAQDMTPGGPTARGTVTIRNQTGKRLRVTPRLLPSTHDLDRLVTVNFSSAGRPVAAGNLAALRAFSGPGLALGVGKQARIALTAEMPQSSSDRYRGRIADLTLEFRALPLGGQVR